MVAGLYVLIQQIENHLLVPQVMHRAVALHPVAVVLAILTGRMLLGIAGVLVAVPITAVLAVALDEARCHGPATPVASDRGT
jgi:predicted PurR-regulated permease PerM